MKQLFKIILAITIAGFVTMSCNNNSADKHTDNKISTTEKSFSTRNF